MCLCELLKIDEKTPITVDQLKAHKAHAIQQVTEWLIDMAFIMGPSIKLKEILFAVPNTLQTCPTASYIDCQSMGGCRRMRIAWSHLN